MLIVSNRHAKTKLENDPSMAVVPMTRSIINEDHWMKSDSLMKMLLNSYKIIKTIYNSMRKGLNITDNYNYNNGYNLFPFNTYIKNRIVMYGKPRGNTNYIKWKQTLAIRNNKEQVYDVIGNAKQVIWTEKNLCCNKRNCHPHSNNKYVEGVAANNRNYGLGWYWFHK